MSGPLVVHRTNKPDGDKLETDTVPSVYRLGGAIS